MLTLILKGALIVALAIKENLLDDKLPERTESYYHLCTSLAAAKALMVFISIFMFVKPSPKGMLFS